MLFVVLLLQSERHFIMQVVCEATQCPDVGVSEARVKEACNGRFNCFFFPPSGRCGCFTEPCEDNEPLLSVHGSVYGPSSICR